VAEELCRQTQVAQHLLHDRPCSVPEPVGVELPHPMGDAEAVAHVLRAANREPFFPARAAVAEERAAISPNDQLVLTSSKDGTVRLWKTGLLS